MRTGRSVEAAKILRAEKAAAAGRLLLGQVRSRAEFIAVGTREYAALPRRSLRSGVHDVRGRLADEIGKCLRSNFTSMTEEKLAGLYDLAVVEIDRADVLVVPIIEFEQRFSSIRPEVLAGVPRYATAVARIGQRLAFLWPEDQLAKDLLLALRLLASPSAESPLGTAMFASRIMVSTAFNLAEATANGLLWEFLQESSDVSGLSTEQRKIIDNPNGAELRSKLMQVPTMFAGRPFVPPAALDRLVKHAKKLRNSLMHPSPFPYLGRHEGYDKLIHFYAVVPDIAVAVVADLAEVLEAVLHHADHQRPPWFRDLAEAAAALKRESSRTAG